MSYEEWYVTNLCLRCRDESLPITDAVASLHDFYRRLEAARQAAFARE